MKIAIINATKPEPDTGDKVTEYAYQLYKYLTKEPGNSVDLVYAMGQTKASNTIGLIYANTIFRSKIPGLAKKGYDLVHITNHEVGFAAKMLKNSNSGAAIVTTVHDTLRLRNDLHRGIRQKAYNNLTTLNIRNALETSDLVIFDDEKVKDEIMEIHDVKAHRIVNLGISNSVIKTPLKRKRRTNRLVVGFIGDSLSSNKNLMLVMRTANLMKNESGFVFKIHGAGAEQESLMLYKLSNDLDNVEFGGPVPESGLVDVLDSFDAFVYPALGETHSLMLANALGRGLPAMIDSRARYVDEIKKHCMKFSDEQQLSRILKELSSTGRNAKSMESALKYARSLTWESTAKETYSIYRTLLKSLNGRNGK